MQYGLQLYGKTKGTFKATRCSDNTWPALKRLHFRGRFISLTIFDLLNSILPVLSWLLKKALLHDVLGNFFSHSVAVFLPIERDRGSPRVLSSGWGAWLHWSLRERTQRRNGAIEGRPSSSTRESRMRRRVTEWWPFRTSSPKIPSPLPPPPSIEVMTALLAAGSSKLKSWTFSDVTKGAGLSREIKNGGLLCFDSPPRLKQLGLPKSR